MTSDYLNYLKSDAWKAKREQRVLLSKNRCEACAKKENLRVHHLTYSRIYREEMDDLMTLCDACHTTIEAAIVSKLLPRKGENNALRVASIAMIHAHRVATTPTRKAEKRKQKKLKPGQVVVNGVIARNPSQQVMMNNPVFVHAIKHMDRNTFRAFTVEQQYSFADHSNAFALYDRWGRSNGRSIQDSYNWIL